MSNQKRLYSLIVKQKNISRAKLAKLTKLSKPTVSALIDQLISVGLIIDGQIGTSEKIGRKPTPLMINADDNYVAVFSWHRTYILAALVNTEYSIVFSQKIPFSASDHYADSTIAALHTILIPHLNGKRILGISIVVPSIIDDQNGRIISSVLDIPPGDNPLEGLAAFLPDYPVVILNDTASFAYAEYTHNLTESDVFVFVNMSRGVGGVLLDEGAMFRGANGMTTQFGHFSVDRKGILCSCGNRGCLECMVGESALERRAQECGVTDIFQGQEYTYEALGHMLDADNAQALILANVLADDLGFALGNMVSLFHPKTIVIGGSGVNLNDRFLQILSQKLHKMSYPLFVENLLLRYSPLGKQSELQGAAEYFMNKHFNFFDDVPNTIQIG